MRLEVQPVAASDIEATAKLYGQVTGDLVPPATQFGWHIESFDISSQARRAAWAADRQSGPFELDPTMRMVKVVDLDAVPGPSQMVSLGRWHDYPEGYTVLGDYEVSGMQSRSELKDWPDGLKKEFFTAMLDGIFATR